VKPDPEARAMKKRRANEEGKAVVVATTTKVTTLGNVPGVKAPRKLNAPFQRVKVDAAKFDDEKLKDNSFDSRVCPLSRVLLDETVLNTL
jgi:hypothetical protein